MKQYLPISPVRLGLALGLICGISTMLLAWAGHMFHYGLPIIDAWASVYKGYAATFVGGFIGGLWGFVGSFVFGLLVAWVYNCCTCCGCCGCSAANCKCDKKSCSTK